LAALIKRCGAPGGRPLTTMQITRTSPTPAYERVLISRSSAGLPRTYRLVRRPGSAPALLVALKRVLR